MKFATVLFFFVAAFGLAVAQPVVISGSAGFNADSPYNRLYNVNTVFTFKGKVAGVELAPPMPGMGNAVTLLVRSSTTGNTYTVEVGPEWYVSNQRTQIKLHDAVQVTGSKVNVNGHLVVLAEQIVKGKSVLTLRRPAGRPYWDAVYAQAPANEEGAKVITGTITQIDTFNDGTNGATERIRIHTEDGDFLVALAPEWFMKRQELQLGLGDLIDVNAFAPSGVPIQPIGTNMTAPPVVFATAVNNGLRWMVLRSANGRPVWYSVDGG